VSQLAAYLQEHGFSEADALSAAYSHYYNQLQVHAHLLAFMDCFHIIGVVTLIAAPLVLLTKYFRVGNAPGDIDVAVTRQNSIQTTRDQFCEPQLLITIHLPQDSGLMSPEAGVGPESDALRMI
jgi:hypothetical protein